MGWFIAGVVFSIVMQELFGSSGRAGSEVWVVGRWQEFGDDGWDLIAAYDSEEDAAEACFDRHCFVLECEVRS